MKACAVKNNKAIAAAKKVHFDGGRIKEGVEDGGFGGDLNVSRCFEASEDRGKEAGGGRIRLGETNGTKFVL